MHPDLIDLGFLHLKTYGAMMALGFLLCWTLIERVGKRKDLSNLLVALMISGIVGARLAYVIEHWEQEFASSPLQILRVDQGGLMFYGGLILAILVFFAWCLRQREPILPLADLFCLVIPLGHACGRIGCFFYGCCYGRDSSAWCAVTFPVGSPSWYEHGHQLVSVLPTQLFEAAALLALFAALFFVYRKRRFPGLVMGIYLIAYAMIRFGIEYLRGDPRAAIGYGCFFLSIGQTISLLMALLGLATITYNAKKRS